MDEYRKCRQCGTTFKVGLFQLFPDMCGSCKEQRAHHRRVEEYNEQMLSVERSRLREEEREERERDGWEVERLENELRKVRRELSALNSGDKTDASLEEEKAKEKELENARLAKFSADLREEQAKESKRRVLNIGAWLFTLICPLVLVHIYTPEDWTWLLYGIVYVLFFMGCAILALIGRMLVGLIVGV